MDNNSALATGHQGGVPITRSYFYRTNGNLCGEPQNQRYSNSHIKGSMYNLYNQNWQQVADHLRSFARLCGSIVKVELSQSNVYPGYLDFIIYFDLLRSAKLFHDHINSLNALQQVNTFLGLTYIETPQLNH